MPTRTETGPSSSPWQWVRSHRLAVFEVVAVVAAVTWIATHADGLDVVRHRLAGVAAVGILFSVVWWAGVAGMVMMLTSLKVPLRRDPEHRHGGPVALVRHCCSLVSGVLEAPPNSRRFKVGWYVNTVIGGFAPGFVLGVGVLLTLPRSAWALAVVPFVEMFASITVRVPMHIALVRRWRAQDEALRVEGRSVPTQALPDQFGPALYSSAPQSA